jgi:hypothetical protein
MRFNHPASIQQLADIAPAALSTTPHPNLMPQYDMVPTAHVLKAFMDSGYGISRASQVQSRDRHYGPDTGKHLICLRPLEFFNELVVGDYIPEIVYTGCHDGSSAIHMMMGIFRVVCSNGMITGEKWASYRITHRKGAEQRALEAAAELLNLLPNLNAGISRMREREVTPEEAQSLALEALKLRYPEHAPFAAEQLLAIRRQDDAATDLWTVLNRIQENIMKGGQIGQSASGRRQTSKPIERISREVEINRQLWTLAEMMLA